MSDQRTEYLGDGVYASYDGYHVILDLRGQPDHNLGDALNRVALEPPVWRALVQCVDNWTRQSKRGAR